MTTNTRLSAQLRRTSAKLYRSSLDNAKHYERSVIAYRTATEIEAGK